MSIYRISPLGFIAVKPPPRGVVSPLVFRWTVSSLFGRDTTPEKWKFGLIIEAWYQEEIRPGGSPTVDVPALVQHGQEAIDAALRGAHAVKAKTSHRDKARDDATRHWSNVNLLSVSEVARRIRVALVKADKFDIPAVRTIRGWIADLAPRPQTRP